MIEVLNRARLADADIYRLSTLEGILGPEDELRIFAKLFAGKEDVRFGRERSALHFDRDARDDGKSQDANTNAVWKFQE